MGLYGKTDWWSLMEEIDEVMEGSGNRCFEKSEYVGYYDELLNEMANAAGDLWNDIQGIKNEICFHDIPYRMRKFETEDDETGNAAFWFNTVALMLTETDANELFWREENFEDCETEKEKRLKMLEKLPKKDLLWIVTRISTLIIKYLELAGAWEAIKGVIEELDSRQAFVKVGNELKEPKAAYL